jgi:hypothetical protein
MTRALLLVLLPAAFLAVSPFALAQPGVHASEPSFDPEIVLATGRTPDTPPMPDRHVAQLHGEYQIRYLRRSTLPLMPSPSDPDADSLGQRDAIFHWLRLSPRVDLYDQIALIGQVDLPHGYFLGQDTRYVGAAFEPMDRKDGLRVDLRWAFAQIMTPVGLLRIGQQGSHWGTGILGNDGNHPRLFGDYSRGGIAERILFATRPLGKDSPLAVIAAGELIYRDVQADLIDGDRAWQGTLAALYGDETNEVGLYGGLRRQRRDRQSIDAFTPYTESLDVVVLDSFARFALPTPEGSGFVLGEGEAAIVAGSTNYVRTPELAARREDEKIRSWGGQITVGYARVAHDEDRRWGDLVLSVEWGYATGDADPNDGVQRRFNFEPNHKVGLVLFDHVLAWTTARSAVNATDPSLVQRPNPGLQFYPSNGGVFGATYLYPTIVIRPKRWLDLKGAALLAQSTADMVDPYEFGVQGRIANARGGDPKRHDLGLELDAGFEVRMAVAQGATLQLGAEGGVLFPGHAFDGPEVAMPSTGVQGRMPTQSIGLWRLGLQY